VEKGVSCSVRRIPGEAPPRSSERNASGEGGRDNQKGARAAAAVPRGTRLREEAEAKFDGEAKESQAAQAQTVTQMLLASPQQGGYASQITSRKPLTAGLQFGQLAATGIAASRSDEGREPVQPTEPMISYASPKFAKKISKVFGTPPSPVKISMRKTNDVPKFLKKFDEIQKRTARSVLQLD